MFIQDVLFALQLSADCFKFKKTADCFSNSACKCANPGKELQCEDCEYLEAYLSHCQSASGTVKTMMKLQH